MARIRPYIQQVETQAGIPSRQAGPDDVGGPGLANLGQAIQRAGSDVARAQALINQDERLAQEKIEQQKRQASTIAVHRIISEEHLKSLQEEQARQQRANPAKPDQHIGEAITFGKQQEEDAINRVIEDPNSPVLPEDYHRIRLGIAENANRVNFAASEFAAKANAAYQVEELVKTHETNRNIVQANPDLLPDKIADLHGLMARVNTGGEVNRQKITNNMRQDLWGAAMDGKIDRVAQSHSVEAIQGLKAMLTQEVEGKDHKLYQNKWQQEVAPAAYAKALDRLNVLEQSEKRQRDILAEAAFKERRDERAAGVNNGFDPAKESTFATDPAKRELLIRDGEAAIRTGNAMQEMNSGSFVQNMQRLAEGDAALKTSGNFHADAEVQKARHAVMSQKLQAIKNDLAGEALKNPVVAKAYQEMQSGKPEAVDGYVRAMQAETERIAPWRELRLLPDAYEGQIKHVLGEMEAGPRGADQALQMLATERSRWGRHWPVVLKQLTQDDILSGPQAVAARMGQDPSAIPDAKRLLVTSALKPDQINDLTPQGSRHDIQQALLKTMAPVAEALRTQVSGEKELARYRDSAETLAMSYLMPGGGETSPEKAAERAAGAVIKNGFHWQGSYYVPKQYNPDTIQRAAEMEKQFVPVSGTEPTHVIPPKSSGLHPNDVTAAVVDSLKNKSRWVVNRAGDGLDLVWETGEQVLIKNSDGTVAPYSRTYQQLQEMGTPTKDWFGRPIKPEAK